jgi:hypothetical protein
VIGPFAKAILCLESAHSTPADVYLFWLTIMATLDHLFKTNESGLRSETIEEIREIANARFDEMINDGPTDVYLTSFFLDPRKCINEW